MLRSFDDNGEFYIDMNEKFSQSLTTNTYSEGVNVSSKSELNRQKHFYVYPIRNKDTTLKKKPDLLIGWFTFLILLIGDMFVLFMQRKTY